MPADNGGPQGPGPITPAGITPPLGGTLGLPETPAGGSPSGGDTDEGSPTDDQYADTLTRITQRLY